MRESKCSEAAVPTQAQSRSRPPASAPGGPRPALARRGRRRILGPMRELRGESRARPLLLIGLLGTLFFGVIDLLSGYEMAFSIFYMIPITFVTLVSVRGDGLAIALLSTGVWLAADLLSGHVYSHWLIPYWNTVVRGIYFVVHVMLLAWLVDSLRRQQELSGRDALTGAASRGRFVESAGLELEKARRSRKPLTIGYIDLDNFKQVNDTLGHDAGDDLLRALVDVVQGSIRASDTIGRLGGDEFALLLPETGFDDAHVVLERLRLAVVADLQRDWPVTLSVGAVTFDLAPSSWSR